MTENEKENPPTNMLQYSFNIESKVNMETSDSMAWESKSFTYGFFGF